MCSTHDLSAGRTDRSACRDGTVRSADGLALFWRAWLPPGRPIAVVGLIHGIAEHSGRYPALVDELVAGGIGVYAIDLRGHGRSAGRRASIRRISDYLDDVDALVSVAASEHPDTPRVLVGYSLGGLASTLYALEHQQQLAGLVLAGPAFGVGEDLPTLVFATVRALAVVMPWLRVLRANPARMTQDPAVVAAYRNDPLVHHGRLDARLLGEIVRGIRRLPRQLGRLQLPLLIVHGADDGTAHPDGSRMAITRTGSADKTLRIYGELRHDVLNEPGRLRVCTDVRQWILTHVRAPGDQIEPLRTETGA